MKINPKSAILCTVGLSLISWSGYQAHRYAMQNFEKSEKAVKYLKANDSNKYIEILEKGIDKQSGADIWEQAAKEVRDSLKIDSVAKTNYAKGAQMVRDSIANVKNNAAKTVMKSVK